MCRMGFRGIVRVEGHLSIRPGERNTHRFPGRGGGETSGVDPVDQGVPPTARSVSVTSVRTTDSALSG